MNQPGVPNNLGTMPPNMTPMAPNQTAQATTQPVNVNGQPQPMPLQMYGTNPGQPGNANQTVSFLDQQQQLIQSNLNPDAVQSTDSAAKASPAKKLTKKQLKKLNSGENLDMSADGTTPKKTPKPRKPKKEKKTGELNNSMSSSGSHTDLAAVGNGEETGENGSNPATTTQSNIDSTIDDFMKQYKAEKKTKKGKKTKANPGDADAEESALLSDSDDSLFGSDGSPQKPNKIGTKSRPKKQKKKDDEPYDEFMMTSEHKKKTPARKKATIAQLDDNGQPLAAAEPAAEVAKAEELFKPDIVCHLKAPELPMIVQRKNNGQRKNNINQLAKLMKGKKRKKKKGSDDDDDDEEDDSDEGYEVPVPKKGAKAKATDPSTVDEGTLDTENDESTAKALQVIKYLYSFFSHLVVILDIG